MQQHQKLTGDPKVPRGDAAVAVLEKGGWRCHGALLSACAGTAHVEAADFASHNTTYPSVTSSARRGTQQGTLKGGHPEHSHPAQPSFHFSQD
eukprot:jgi/Tetstr1/460833/TSEL_005994.t1